MKRAVFERRDVHESISQRGVEADRQRWRGWRQGAAHILCGLGERGQFIISAQFQHINCLGFLEIYILYNYFVSIVSDESHSSQ